MDRYKIVRMYFRGGKRTVSSTCKQARNVRRTRQKGAWFDGYEKE